MRSTCPKRSRMSGASNYCRASERPVSGSHRIEQWLFGLPRLRVVTRTATARRRVRALYGWFFLGSAAALVGVPINLITSSGWPRLLSLLLVIFGLTVACVGPGTVLLEVLQEFLDVLSGQRVPDRPEALLDRLNRGAAEYRDLVDAISKLVIPILVGLIALTGVVLTVITVLD